MSLCEQYKEEFEKLLKDIPEHCFIKLHGSYRYPVYRGWKGKTQNYDDLHILYVWGGQGTYHMDDGVDIPLHRGALIFISHGINHYATINNAYLLLTNSNLPVGTVAEQIGYNDIFAFSKAFKKYFGYPPIQAKKLK